MRVPWIKTIAVLKMIGGVVGILFILYGVVSADFAPLVVIIGSFCTGVSVLSMLAGSWLWQGLPKGRTASLIIQFIQLPKIMSAPIVFMFSFGFDLFPQIGLFSDQTTWGIQLRFLADSQVFLNTQEKGMMLGVSIPAIIAIAKLWNYDTASTDAVHGSRPLGPDTYFSTDSRDL